MWESERAPQEPLRLPPGSIGAIVRPATKESSLASESAQCRAEGVKVVARVTRVDRDDEATATGQEIHATGDASRSKLRTARTGTRSRGDAYEASGRVKADDGRPRH